MVQSLIGKRSKASNQVLFVVCKLVIGALSEVVYQCTKSYEHEE